MHDDDIEDYQTCPHGIYNGYWGGYCEACDIEEEKNGGIDKCLNCGRYKWGNQLNKNQCCKTGCINPNEY
jgi:hypothetical protein